ncbi:MAG: ribonuclease H-like domain-containing protein [Treponema sp.]|jgi:uncharacterized protein YprB with RNaseH-like and TPR domain|nr:ribonuclease H-like domain-containing protein [Treponema sp.]
MSERLKDRLQRYRDKTKAPVSETKSIPAYQGENSTCEKPNHITWPGWNEAGFLTMKRQISVELSLPYAFPATLAIIVPDFAWLDKMPSPENLLFFDLETTGLSGGAGTVAFLAAFGSFVAGAAGNAKLVITQYLLLDYPGESDFIDIVVKEFSASPSPIVISFNGKSFDSQILKTRCLMNGVKPPVIFHADLLHPARCLWKKSLPDCSQTTIEVSVLGLDRTGDVPGSLAPEIWFSFLRNGDNVNQDKLLSVCDHNARDISGLADLFLVMGEIAADPIKSQKKYYFDWEVLAILWQKALKRKSFFHDNDDLHHRYVRIGKHLLENAVSNGSLPAAVILAKEAEWRLKDYKLALSYTDIALNVSDLPDSFREELEKRRRRLEAKAAHSKLTGSTSTSR